jgi:nitrogen fixation protein FixH
MLVVLIGFFAAVLAANLTLVYFARHSWTGLVVQNSYVASQKFNENTVAMAKAAQIEVRIDVTKAQLQITLRGRSGQMVDARAVALKLGRPSHEGEDRTIFLAAQGEGVFSAPQTLSHGQWSGTVSADVPGQENWMRPVYLLVKE